VFPLIIVFADKLISEEKTSPKTFLAIFMLFLFSATSFANFAIIYLNLFIISLFGFLKITIDKKPILKTIYRLILFGLILFLSNSWWLVSYFYEIYSNNIIYIATSSSTITENITKVPALSFINTLLLGKTAFNYVVSENEKIFNLLNLASMSFIWIFFIKFILSKTFRIKKTYSIFLFLMMVILFLAKGFSYPFPDVFSFLFYKVPGFISFRNSHNKFYWFFWYCLLLLSTAGLVEFLIKNTKKYFSYLLLLLICIPVFYIVVFIKHPQLGLFNIPDYYKQVNQHLIIKNNSTRILLLPPIQSGYSPFFGSDSNYYHGINYIPYMINYPFITLATETSQTNSLANKINNGILQKKPICDYLKKLNISDILVLHDINQNVQSLSSVDQSINNMKKMNEFTRHIMFNGVNQNGIYLFEVDKKCVGSFVSLDNNKNNSISYKIIDPVTMQANVHLHDSANLQLLMNFNNNWVALVQKYNEEKINIINQLLFKNVLDTKNPKPLYNYANSWHLDKNFIIKSFSPEYYKVNPDNSIDVKFTIYYKSQSYQYVGLILFSVFSILSVSFLLLFSKLKK